MLCVYDQYKYLQCVIDFRSKNLKSKVALRTVSFNPLAAKLSNLIFCLADPQLQVSENYSDLTTWRSIIFKFLLIDVTFYLQRF